MSFPFVLGVARRGPLETVTTVVNNANVRGSVKTVHSNSNRVLISRQVHKVIVVLEILCATLVVGVVFPTYKLDQKPTIHSNNRPLLT